MAKRIFFAIMVIFSCFILCTPDTALASWAKAFGIAGSNGGGVSPTFDCNYFLWLTSGSGITKTIQASELNSSGEPQWTKKISGTGENDLMVLPMADGGYFVYGKKTSDSTGDDILWEKFDSSWNEVYGNTFGGAKDESGGPNFTEDGGFLISGTTTSYPFDGSDKDMLLVKVSSSGTIEWNKAINYSLNDGSPSITEESDGYLFTATVQGDASDVNNIGQDVLVVKLDESGNRQWQKLYRGTVDGGTWINTLSAPKEITGGYLMWGTTKASSTFLFNDILLVKMDDSGEILWQKRYGGDTDTMKGAYTVIENADGTFLMEGYIMNRTTYANTIFLMKLDSTGNINWQKTLSGPGSTSASLTETSDGEYLLSGVTSTYTPTFDPGNILYAKLDIDLANGSITYPWGSAKTFGSTGFESGGVFEYFDQYMLFGYTTSWGVGSMNVLGIFYLDSDGILPGCQYFQDVILTEGTSGLSQFTTALATTDATLTDRQVGTAGALNLTVTTATNPTVTPICSGTTTDTYTIAGTITFNGMGLNGVIVTLSGGTSQTTTTDDSGEYSFHELSNGTYTITPSVSGYTFTPPSKQVTTSCALQLGVDFTASTGGGGTYSISGKVTLSGSGLGGVTMTLSGSSSGTATTDSSGNYTFSGLSNGTYTVTPSKSGYSFTPTSLTLTISGANQTDKNFTASQGGGGCSAWSDVIAKYNQYVSGQASWSDVISCYTAYASH